MFLNDTELTRHWLDQLQEMGVTISLDDFGTGYSSLSYLHTYPLNKVKIDRSFLQGVSKSHRPLKLLHGVARLSADLGMSVAVEGIETEEQLALVSRERCVEEVQGFLFSPAMPSGDIRQMLLAPPARIEPGCLTFKMTRAAHRGAMFGAADERLMFTLGRSSAAHVAQPAFAGLAVHHRLDLAPVDADVVQAAVVERAQHQDAWCAAPARPVGLPASFERAGEPVRARTERTACDCVCFDIMAASWAASRLAFE